MWNGENKNIEDLIENDLVLDGNKKPQRVKHLMKFENNDKKYSINGSEYFVTGAHPFKSTVGWKAFNPQVANITTPGLNITQLKVGDILLKEEGTEIVIAIDWIRNSEAVYNIEVSGSHEYIANGFQVHNKKKCTGTEAPPEIEGDICSKFGASLSVIRCMGVNTARMERFKCL
jgi:hypothetical protein